MPSSTIVLRTFSRRLQCQSHPWPCETSAHVAFEGFQGVLCALQAMPRGKNPKAHMGAEGLAASCARTHSGQCEPMNASFCQGQTAQCSLTWHVTNVFARASRKAHQRAGTVQVTMYLQLAGCHGGAGTLPFRGTRASHCRGRMAAKFGFAKSASMLHSRPERRGGFA